MRTLLDKIEDRSAVGSFDRRLKFLKPPDRVSDVRRLLAANTDFGAFCRALRSMVDETITGEEYSGIKAAVVRALGRDLNPQDDYGLGDWFLAEGGPLSFVEDGLLVDPLAAFGGVEKVAGAVETPPASNDAAVPLPEGAAAACRTEPEEQISDEEIVWQAESGDAGAPEVLKPTILVEFPPLDPDTAAAPKGSGTAARDPRALDREVKLPFRTAKAIARETPGEVAWIVPGMLAAGAVTELIGKVKLAGKTTFTLAMVKNVSEGTPFLGHPTSKSPVVMLTEQPPSSFRQAIQRAGLEHAEEVFILYHHDVQGLDWREVARGTVLQAERFGAKVIIVDTFGRFAGGAGDENSAGESEAAVLAIVSPATARGIAVLITRHERKSGGELVDAGRGSSAISGVMDIVLQLRRPENAIRSTIRTLHAVGRFDDLPDDISIELVDQTYVLIEPSETPVLDAATVKVLAALPSTPNEGLKVEEVAKAAGIARTTTQEVLKALRASGQAGHTGTGSRNNAQRYFRIVADGEVVSDVASTNQTPNHSEPAPVSMPVTPIGIGVAVADAEVRLDADPATSPSDVNGGVPSAMASDRETLIALQLKGEIVLRLGNNRPRLSIDGASKLLTDRFGLQQEAARPLIHRFDGLYWKLSPGRDRWGKTITFLEKIVK